MPSSGRRQFLKFLLSLSGLGFILAWKEGMESSRAYPGSSRKICLPSSQSVPAIISDVLFVPEERGWKAFDARCTHLGCLVQVHPDGHILCPCHGSEYDLSGSPVRGPALKGLRELEIKQDTDGSWYVLKDRT